MGRAVAVVDVEPVGLAADDGDPGTGLTEGARGDLRGSSVRSVDDDVQSLEPVRQGGQQVGDIAVSAVGERRDAADVTPGGALPLVAQPVLDAVLEVVGELVAAPCEELDAVVGHGVVRGREHGTEVGVLLPHEVGDGGGRQHAGVAHVDAGRGEARHGRCGEELPRRPRVASDDRNGSVAVEGAHLRQYVRRGDGEIERELGGDVLVRHTTDAVRAEESSHACSAFPRGCGRGRSQMCSHDDTARRGVPSPGGVPAGAPSQRPRPRRRVITSRPGEAVRARLRPGASRRR